MEGVGIECMLSMPSTPELPPHAQNFRYEEQISGARV